MSIPKIEVNINGQSYLGLVREEHLMYSNPGTGDYTRCIIDLYDLPGVNAFGSIEVTLNDAIDSRDMNISLKSSKN